MGFIDQAGATTVFSDQASLQELGHQAQRTGSAKGQVRTPAAMRGRRRIDKLVKETDRKPTAMGGQGNRGPANVTVQPPAQSPREDGKGASRRSLSAHRTRCHTGSCDLGRARPKFSTLQKWISPQLDPPPQVQEEPTPELPLSCPAGSPRRIEMMGPLRLNEPMQEQPSRSRRNPVPARLRPMPGPMPRSSRSWSGNHVKPDRAPRRSGAGGG
jgi:hypothetical protein